MKQYSEILACGLSRYKTLLALVSGAMVGNTLSHYNELLPPSHENKIDLNKDNYLDANYRLALGFSSYINKGSIPSTNNIAEKGFNTK